MFVSGTCFWASLLGLCMCVWDVDRRDGSQEATCCSHSQFLVEVSKKSALQELSIYLQHTSGLTGGFYYFE